jgi:hypothetical protein
MVLRIEAKLWRAARCQPVRSMAATDGYSLSLRSQMLDKLARVER